MNLYTQTLKNFISSLLTALITVSCFAGANAGHATETPINRHSSEGSFTQAINPDAGFTVTENTTIDQSISLWGNILVKSGYTLTVNGKFTLSSGTLTIETGATVIVNNTLDITGGKLVLAGGRIFVMNLSISNSNYVSGSGGIKIENTFSNQSSPGWPGHALTASNNVKVCYSSTGNFGNGVQTCSDPMFDQVLPIKIVKGSFKFNRVIRKAQ